MQSDCIVPAAPLPQGGAVDTHSPPKRHQTLGFLAARLMTELEAMARRAGVVEKAAGRITNILSLISLIL